MKIQIILGVIIIMISGTGCSSNSKLVCNYGEGISKEYYKDSQIKSELLCKDGKLNGISKFYYESGKLKSEMNYINGKLEGESKTYWVGSSTSVCFFGLLRLLNNPIPFLAPLSLK